MNSDFVKNHWGWIAGGIAGLILLYYMSSGPSAATTTVAGTAANPALLQAELQAQAQDAQLQAQQQAQANQMSLASQQLTAQIDAANAAIQVNYLTAEGGAASQIASSYANIITARAQLPAATIAGADKIASAALTSSAYTVGAGLTAAGAATAGFGAAIGQLGQSTSTMITNGLAISAANSKNTMGLFGSLGSAAISSFGF